MPTIRLEHVAKIYKSKTREAIALLDIDLKIEQGEFIFFVGSRGAGKSTLMDIICGVIQPDRGTVYLDDINLNKMSRRESEKVRASIGRISQEAELNRTETVFENMSSIERVGLFKIKRKRLDKIRVEKALGLVGMPNCGERYPRDLRPSECRRIQMAKAILNSPDILMIDDFTEQMDEDTIWDMIHLLNELNRGGTTVLMATNSSMVVNIMRKRVITLADGKIVGDVQKGRYGYIV